MGMKSKPSGEKSETRIQEWTMDRETEKKREKTRKTFKKRSRPHVAAPTDKSKKRERKKRKGKISYDAKELKTS